MASIATKPRTRRMVTLCVLVAEDEAMIALTLVDLLEAEGYDVAVAGDGARALAIARQFGDQLDILVTDLNMPEMRGEDLIRAIRKERPDLPVVVVTGSPPLGGLEELQRQCGGTGPLALVQKPIDYAELTEVLRHAARSGHDG